MLGLMGRFMDETVMSNIRYISKDLFAPFTSQIITTDRAGGMHKRPWRIRSAVPIGTVKIRQPHLGHGLPLKGLFLFALLCRLTRERVNVFFQRQLFFFIILLQLISYVFCNRLFIASYCIYIISSTPKISIAVFIF